eukprot:CAMPEP_0195082612 /NCGR_PEP_ID=MMETSP0448-20130528/23756_1 /TAXON_ID=66468 /ORGANISM="Heterocapsa triquestra, Strain CCMP 448" /LENGTH=410 /DNA_ID=CAMNT_0040115741 /DNA_START=106 /DNA_END=1338 /DNA_ORIENTATION=+
MSGYTQSEGEDDEAGEDLQSSGEECNEDDRATNRPLLITAFLSVAFIAVAFARFRTSPAAPGGVEDAWVQCSGAGRLGGPRQDVHIHFLLMTMDDVAHPDIWRAFFDGAPSGSYSAWVHCKYPDKCRANLAQSGLAEFKLVPTVYSEWCFDLVSPMLQMVRSALAENVLPPGVPEKFVFLSAQALPLKPFSVIRAELGKHPSASDFCVYPPSWWSQGKVDNTTFAVAASQWSILAKEDAEVLVNRMPAPSADHRVQLPDVQGVSWDNMSYTHCPDEIAVFPTIFGLYHQDGTGVGFYPGVGQIREDGNLERGCCRTWGFQQGEKNREATLMYLEQNSQLGKVLKQLLSDKESDVRGPMTHSSGNDDGEILWIVYRLGPAGLRAIRDSVFLFGRKFSDNASLPGYADIMFS